MDGDGTKGRAITDCHSGCFAPNNQRIEAVRSLGVLNPSVGKVMLLELGARTAEPEELLTAVGRELARIDHDGIVISEFDVRDLTGAAYEAFCDGAP